MPLESYNALAPRYLAQREELVATADRERSTLRRSRATAALDRPLAAPGLSVEAPQGAHPGSLDDRLAVPRRVSGDRRFRDLRRCRLGHYRPGLQAGLPRHADGGVLRRRVLHAFEAGAARRRHGAHRRGFRDAPLRLLDRDRPLQPRQALCPGPWRSCCAPPCTGSPRLSPATASTESSAPPRKSAGGGCWGSAWALRRR